VTAIAVPLLLVVAGAASAATWNQQQTPIPPGASTWQFSAVSCQPAGGCMAVGTDTSSTSTSLLVEQRLGTTWTVLSAPVPAGAVSSELLGISCPSATGCTAVGDYSNGIVQSPFAESWNGTSWSIQSTPVGGGASDAQLSGVSCSAAGSCVAVGYYNLNGTTTLFADLLHGSSWTLMTPDVPAGSTGSNLGGVSCLSASDCVAVGEYSNSSGDLTLAEAWNGSGWTMQTTPNETAGDSVLTGVSCTSATGCTAVGAGAMALRWNGTAWSQEKFASPGPGSKPTISQVSCISATSCSAVGEYDLSGIAYAAAESWDGTTWAFQDVDVSSSYDTDSLSGVSCQSPGVCTAVGAYHDPVDGYQSLVATIVLGWQAQAPPLPYGAVSSTLGAVSCPSGTFCLAVGDYTESPSGTVALTETWHGTNWIDGVIPNGSTTNLTGVSCKSATACTAVGNSSTASGLVPMAAGWNGTSWTEQDLPLPSGMTLGEMYNVSCATATSCLAVGTAVSSSSQTEPVAELWNGTSWTVSVIPGLAGSAVEGVSCWSATGCMTVGEGTSSSVSASWNGSTWTVRTTHDPAASSYDNLGSVSCRSASFCMAVGLYDSASHQYAMSQSWNGSAWTLSPVASLPSTTASGLNQVSCSAATSCMAVGVDVKTGVFSTFPLAEQWNGTSWTAPTLGAPSGSTGGDLNGVSCVSTIDCMTVGYYIDTYEEALAELYS
jgi:hypothetical protein